MVIDIVFCATKHCRFSAIKKFDTSRHLKLFLSVLETKKKTVLQVLFNSFMNHMWIMVIYRVYVGIWTKSSNVYWEVNIESTKSMYVQKFGRGSTARGGGATVRRRVYVCVCACDAVCVGAARDCVSLFCLLTHYVYLNESNYMKIWILFHDFYLFEAWLGI